MRLDGMSSWSIQWILLIFLRYVRTASRHCDVNDFGVPEDTTTVKIKTVASDNDDTIITNDEIYIRFYSPLHYFIQVLFPDV